MHPATYQQKHEDCEKQLQKTSEACSRIIFWRGITSVCAILLFCTGFSQKNLLLLLCGAAALTVFLLFVHRHGQLKSALDDLACRRDVLADYLARYSDSWKNFPLTGERYLDGTPEPADLDIFGKNSLYQYICTAGTIQGQDILAGWLRSSEKNPAQIKERQKAAAELAAQPAFCTEFETAARKLRDIPYAEAQKTMEHLFCSTDSCIRFRSVRKTAAWLLPFLTVLFLVFTILGFQRSLFLPCFSFLISLQLLLCLAGYQKISRLLVPAYKMNESVRPYQKLIKALEEASFSCDYLRNIQHTLTDGASALKAFRELEAITESVIVRKNLFAFVMYNSLFLYDWHCTERYIRWKENYQKSIRSWLEAAGTAEALISLCVIYHVKAVHTLPEIKTDTLPHPVFSAEELSHPLLKESDAVGNDFAMTHRTCIITGSNMSGKTTFMRSIGVNLILAYAGGFCTAKSLAVSPMELCTSMRVQDNVSEGISTFYAELLRIKRMTDIGKKQVPMIALIDEIYKGTNSRDRIYAAGETVRKLSQPYAFTILTTHDFELCDLENSSETDAENYYFEEHYEQNQILFDYKIRKGRSTSSNARYLLRMAGILPDE